MQNIEISLFGIRRTGNHAIISWIIEHYPGPLVFVNNVNGHDTIPFPESPIRPGTEHPFQDRITVKKLPYYKVKEKCSSLIKYVFTRPSTYSLVPSDTSVNLDYLLEVGKDLFMYSFEDIHPSDSRFINFDQSINQYIGMSQTRMNIVMLRDPFNLFASLLQSEMMKRTTESSQKYIQLFKDYATTFLSHESISTDSTAPSILINYNSWVANAEYRTKVSQQLGLLPSAQNVFQKVSTRGGGSSFDQTTYSRNASQMKVFERWKGFKDDPFYLNLFKDDELVDLSNQIFGAIAPEIV
ncbi:MAG: hypothetical protein F6K16_36790 [Symploca sp. SIO2B6]|nr:hypothetical protein [Symploca sp. SIO2B6]